MDTAKFLKHSITAFLFLFAVSVCAQNLVPTVSSTFRLSDNSFDISSNMGTPSQRAMLAMTNPDYLVTPGDVYKIGFVSSAGPQVFTVLVDYDYRLNLSTIGAVYGKGKTFLQLKEEISAMVQDAYPLSAPEVLIVEAGAYQVYITGEVTASQEVTAWSFLRLSHILNGKTTPYSCVRNITITRADGSSREYDLFKAARYGDTTHDPYIHFGDRIHVARATNQITLQGAVYREGEYQLMPGETLKDLIDTYGEGFLDNADISRIRVLRSVGGQDKVGQRFEVAFEEATDFGLENFDQVSIAKLQSFLPVVFFEGAVMVKADDITRIDLTVSQRIPYSFYPGETLADSVRSMREQFTQISDLQKAYIQRNGDIIQVDLNRYLYEHDFTEDILLKPNDKIVIPFRQFFVTVSGAVRIPGRYPYVPDRSWRYYVNLAGGIDPLRNSYDSFKVYTQNDSILKDVEVIPPEAKIEVATNSFLFYFNQYAPVITTIIGILSTTIGIMATTGNL